MLAVCACSLHLYIQRHAHTLNTHAHTHTHMWAFPRKHALPKVNLFVEKQAYPIPFWHWASSKEPVSCAWMARARA